MSLALHASIIVLSLMGQLQGSTGGMQPWDDVRELQELVKLHSRSIAEV